MNKIRKACFVLSLILLNLNLSAQQIKGFIQSESDESPVEYVSVSLYQLPDSNLVTGVLTDPNGAFKLSLPYSLKGYLSIQFMGFETLIQPVREEPGELDLGVLFLAVNSQILEEVVVSGRSIDALYKIDKQVFKANQFAGAQGGNAVDVLRNLPSVTVDALGGISLRGEQGFILMLDGRPFQGDPASILAQIPANAIQNIEVITTPSAQYDPDGKAGIINITTSKGLNNGFYLNANILGGLPSIEDYGNANSTPRYGADLNLDFQKDRWQVSAGLDYRRYDISGQRDGYVSTYLNEVLTEFPSFGERSFDEENYSGRVSAVFTPNKNQSWGASLFLGKRNKERTADILYENQQRRLIPNSQFLAPETYYKSFQNQGTLWGEGKLVNQLSYFNENLRVRRGDFAIGALDYTIKFNEGGQLKLSGLYERTLLGGPTDNRNLSYPGLRDTFQLQFNDNDNPLDGVRLQADFSKTKDQQRIAYGYQYRSLKHPGDFIYLDRDFDQNGWVINPEFTNGIELRRSIHSIYGQLSDVKGRLSYTVGLRLEYFDREVQIDQPDETFTLDQFNPFPSVQLQYDLGKDFKIKAGYSRRIERTTTFKMTPFPEREHSETLEQGDAELQPEYVDLAEVGLIKTWEDHSLSLTGYYRNIDNVINRVNTIYNDTILNRIYTNAGQASALGAELALSLVPVKWARFFVGANVYNYKIKGTLFEDQINTSNTIYSINTNINLDVSSRTSFQLGLNYLSERVTAQGRDSRFYNPYFSIQHKFKDERFSVGFQWLNLDLGILDSNEQRITTVRSNFFTTTNYVYEVDIVQLTLSYRFNQTDKSLKLLKSEFGDKEF